MFVESIMSHDTKMMTLDQACCRPCASDRTEWKMKSQLHCSFQRLFKQNWISHYLTSELITTLSFVYFINKSLPYCFPLKMIGLSQSQANDHFIIIYSDWTQIIWWYTKESQADDHFSVRLPNPMKSGYTGACYCRSQKVVTGYIYGRGHKTVYRAIFCYRIV